MEFGIEPEFGNSTSFLAMYKPKKLGFIWKQITYHISQRNVQEQACSY